MQAQPQGSSLRDLVRQGYVAPIWCDGREILRRLFVTVRDRQWREVGPTRFEYAIDEAAGTVSFNARHVNEEVDFEWRGLLKVTDSFRQVRFAIEGKALRDMDVCRVGLVVLHPVDAMVDSQLSVLSRQGDQRLTVPRLISPQPILNGIPQAMTAPFSGLVVERSDFGRLELQFSGELFEIEDQRNWGDTSFKTYCTPLRLGFPRRMAEGTTIAHAIESCFVSAGMRAERSATKQVVEPRAVFPRITCGEPPVQLRRSPGVAVSERMLTWGLNRKIELQVELGTDAELPDVLGVSQFGLVIERAVVCAPGSSIPSGKAIERFRNKLESSCRVDFPILAATRGYFVEFNRGLKFEAPVNGIAFPLTATVHADDSETVTENVTAPVDIAETARHLTGLSEIVISPLALYHPQAATPARFPKALVSSWLTATLIYAALGGITAVTLADDVLDALDSSDNWFLLSLLDCAGLKVSPVRSMLPTGVHALAFVPNGRGPARLLVANLNSGAVNLVLDEDETELEGYEATWIELSR